MQKTGANALRLVELGVKRHEINKPASQGFLEFQFGSEIRGLPRADNRSQVFPKPGRIGVRVFSAQKGFRHNESSLTTIEFRRNSTTAERIRGLRHRLV